MATTLVACALASPVPAEAAVLTAKLVAASDIVRAVVAHQSVQSPFVVRVVDNNGRPMPDVTVSFSPLLCVQFTTPPAGARPCPDQSLYGRFVGDHAGDVISDAEGYARAPEFTAAAIPGTYVVSTSIPEQRYGSDYIAMNFFGVLFTVHQLASPPAPIPAYSSWAALLSVASLAIAALRRLRRHMSSGLSVT